MIFFVKENVRAFAKAFYFFIPGITKLKKLYIYKEETLISFYKATVCNLFSLLFHLANH